MKTFSTIVFGLIMSTIFTWGAEIKLHQVHKNVTLVQAIQEQGYTQNLIVVETEPGLIAIDTGFPLEVAREMKEAVSKKLGRDDFIYLINTHGHMDHSIGNQFYKQAVKIAHAKAVKEMANNVKQWNQKYFTSNFILTYPDITFEQYLRLKVGKLNFHLYYPGPSHTDNHILIHIPELNILCVGDCFHPNFPPYIDKGYDIKGMIDVLTKVSPWIGPETIVLPGHRNPFKGDFIKAVLQYYRDLYHGVRSLRWEHVSLENAKKILLKRISRQGMEKAKHWDPKKHVDEIFLHNIQTAWEILKK